LADAGNQRPVDGDTLFVCFSCDKGVVATAIHLLAERGRIDYDTPVAEYWPAFGASGKAEITVGQVLNQHRWRPAAAFGLDCRGPVQLGSHRRRPAFDARVYHAPGDPGRTIVASFVHMNRGDVR